MSARPHSGELNEIIVTVLADTVTHSVWEEEDGCTPVNANAGGNIKSEY